MQKKLFDIVVCPNSFQPGFILYATELIRNNHILYNVNHPDIMNDDDIKSGVAVSESCRWAYPVSDFIGVFLAKYDSDKHNLKDLFDQLGKNIPSYFLDAINFTIKHIFETNDSDEGNWNREEMNYYDADVDTIELRNKMLHSISEIPLWRIFLPRKKHIIDVIAQQCTNNYVLEIGCGNSRTIANMFNPVENNYSYIGTDISFKRLVVAKKAVPSGNFLQASALNLPFVKKSFAAAISFGMLHHLPRPVDALAHIDEMLSCGGYLALHEPIIREQLPFVDFELIRKLFRTYRHSQHDGKINYESTMKLLADKKHRIVHHYNQISVFRTIAESLLNKLSNKFILNKYLIRFLEFTDQLPLKTVCLLSKRLGPNAVIIVSKKES